jgi:hypothetical protein
MQAWWHLPVMTLGTLRQEDHEFNTSLGYTVRPTLKKKNHEQKSYVLPHMWTLDQGQTQQGDWTLST